MTDELNLMAVYAAVVGVSAATVGIFAYVCAKRRSIKLFVGLIAAILVGAACLLVYSSSDASFTPGRVSIWRHIASSLVLLAPLAIIPTAFTMRAAFSGANLQRVLLLATAGAVLALPVAIYVGVLSSCYFSHDCL